jgi:hypothetical protein
VTCRSGRAARCYPPQAQLVLPLVDEVIRHGGRALGAQMVAALADRVGLDAETRAQTTTIAAGRVRMWDRHARWVYQRARALGLLRSPSRGVWEATESGRSRLRNAKPGVVVSVFRTAFGEAFWACAETFVECLEDGVASLIVTSPPYLLTKAKPYGGPSTETEYVEWIVGLVRAWNRILAPDGTIVLNLGPGWERGRPTMSLYRERVYLRLHDELGLHLAQDGYWDSPSKMPTPAEWVTVRRERLKPSVEHVYAFSRDPHPAWSNRRVLEQYSPAMRRTLGRGGGIAAVRPSGHSLAEHAFGVDNGGSIPSHLRTIPHTRSSSDYLHHCRQAGLPPHPARFPEELAAFYIELCTVPETDLVVDFLAGSQTVAQQAERLRRPWLTCERALEYIAGGAGRFLGVGDFTPAFPLPGLRTHRPNLAR